MRSSNKLIVSLCVLVILALSLTGCGPQVAGPFTIQHAIELEKQNNPQDSLSIYAQVVRANQQTNPDVAAQALYDGGKYASDPVRYGKTDALKNQGLDMAATLWKQLRDDFPKQAEKLLQIGQPGDQLAALRTTINKRNSKDFKYQAIDSLVALTGRNPSFSYAFALVLLSIIVRTLIFPLTKKQYASQREMQRIQPKIKELQNKYKGPEHRQELQAKQMELYKEEKVNPFASCLPALIQMPFLILVFTAIREYEFAFSAGTFLWIGSPLSTAYPHIVGADLARPDVALLLIYAVTNYITMKLTPMPDPQQQQQQNTMALMTTVMFFFIFLNYKWSSAFVLYWVCINLISIFQQYKYIYKPHVENKKTMAANEILNPTPAKSANKNGSSPVKDIKQIANAVEAGNTEAAPARVKPRRKKK